jgi:hypothetical protein
MGKEVKALLFLNLPEPQILLRGLTNQLLYLLGYATGAVRFQCPLLGAV